MNSFVKPFAHPLLTGLLLLVFMLPVFTATPSAAQDVSGAVALDAMAEAMQRRGLTPPPGSNLSLDDYIRTKTTTNARGRTTRHVGFWIGPDGHVIPDGEWRDARPDYCKRKARYMRAPAMFMDFEIHRNTETADGVTRNQLTVFARWSNAKTGIMTSASEGEATNITGRQLASEGYAADALEAAWANMQGLEAKAPDDPCGKVRLKHVQGEKVGERFVFRAGFRGLGKALVYTWDFGDGSAPVEGRSSQRARHVYDAAGTYEVSVRVRQMDGETNTNSISVRVNDEEEEASSEFDLTFSGDANGTVRGSAQEMIGGGPLRLTESADHAADCDVTMWLVPEGGIALEGQNVPMPGSEFVPLAQVWLTGPYGEGTYRLAELADGPRQAQISSMTRQLVPGADWDHFRNSPRPLSGTIEITRWDRRGSASPQIQAVLRDVVMEDRNTNRVPGGQEVYTYRIDGRITALLEPGQDVDSICYAAEEPPAESPPAESPPAESPPAESPPAESPSAESPPAEGPPAEGPPAEGPPAEGPPTDEPASSATVLGEIGHSSKFTPLESGSAHITGAVERSYEVSANEGTIALQAICAAGAPAILNFQLPGQPEGARIVSSTRRPLAVGSGGQYELGMFQLMMPDTSGPGIFSGAGTLKIEENTVAPKPRIRGLLQAERLKSPIGGGEVSIDLTFDVPRSCGSAGS